MHRSGYQFKSLVKFVPDLQDLLITNKNGSTTIDFSDPLAVKLLNKALLLADYKLNYWTIPKGYLCPPVPGRADYLHYLSDLMADYNNGRPPRGQKLRCLDIGVGANCIYPIIARRLFDWSVVGSDIDTVALNSARKIINNNQLLKGHVELRQQKNKNHILKGVFSTDEYFDCVISNPPFYTSREAAMTTKNRKIKNLSSYDNKQDQNNFGGQANELWCEGGEKWFISQMIQESTTVSKNCFIFTSLLSNRKYENELLTKLKKAKATIGTTIPMQQGNKTSRIICWTFLSPKQQKVWAKTRWA